MKTNFSVQHVHHFTDLSYPCVKITSQVAEFRATSLVETGPGKIRGQEDRNGRWFWGQVLQGEVRI